MHERWAIPYKHPRVVSSSSEQSSEDMEGDDSTSSGGSSNGIYSEDEDRPSKRVRHAASSSSEFSDDVSSSEAGEFSDMGSLQSMMYTPTILSLWSEHKKRWLKKQALKFINQFKDNNCINKDDFK